MSVSVRSAVAVAGALLAVAAFLIVWLAPDREIDGFATANPHPVFPTEHVYNRQDLAGYTAAEAAASMLARGYTDVRYASTSARVPTGKGCTPKEIVGVYGVSPDGIVWLQILVDPADSASSTPSKQAPACRGGN